MLSEESRLHPAKDEKIMAILGSRANISSERASSETSATDGGVMRVPSIEPQRGLEEVGIWI